MRLFRAILSGEQPKINLEDRLKEEIGRRLEAEADRDNQRAKNKSLTETVSRLRKKEGVDSTPIAPPDPPAAAPHVPPEPEAKGVEHARSITDQFCPECGDANPEFKDETECKECGRSLGAVETLSRVKQCPSCGASGKIAIMKKAKATA